VFGSAYHHPVRPRRQVCLPPPRTGCRFRHGGQGLRFPAGSGQVSGSARQGTGVGVGSGFRHGGGQIVVFATAGQVSVLEIPATAGQVLGFWLSGWRLAVSPTAEFLGFRRGRFGGGYFRRPRGAALKIWAGLAGSLVFRTFKQRSFPPFYSVFLFCPQLIAFSITDPAQRTL